MPRILIIEDEPDMAAGLKDNFEFEGYEAVIANDGESGLALALSRSPDLILLDIMLPKKSGLDVCRELRMRKNKTPIIMLTAKGQEIDKVLGLELGADDYITKPFGVRELLARVKAVLRRYSDQDKNATQSITMGRLTLNFQYYEAADPDGPVKFTHREFELLKYFHENMGKTITRNELLNKVWGYESYPTSRTVDNHILNLRKRLEPDPAHPRHILTVHGMGYKYIE
ncbi:response regulator transcription factor [candidate division KSB1 bacterium]|nr:response regulator transcription factor [candidate division KSB1 bacterium]